MEVPMLNKAYETVDKIVSSKHIKYAYIALELYDVIFQRRWSDRQRKRLFVYAVIRLNDMIYHFEDSGSGHLFTAMIEDGNQIIDPLSEEDIGRMRDALVYIKRIFSHDILKASLMLYKYFNSCVPMELRYVTFATILKSGFIPFDQPHLAYLRGTNNDDLLDKALRRMEIMEWLSGGSDFALITFAMNLINEHKKFALVQHGILVKLAAQMKARAVEGVMSQFPRTTDGIGGPIDWVGMKARMDAKTTGKLN